MTTENQSPDSELSESTTQTDATGSAQTPPADTPPPVAGARKRGRPSNAEKAQREAGASTVEQIEKGAATGPASKPRAKGNQKRVTQSDISSLAKQLVGLHQLGAMLSGIPEIMIAEPEGAALATGIVAVCEEYDLSIDGKTGAALQLLGACAMVYVPKIFMFKARMAKAKAEADARREAGTIDATAVEVPNGNPGFASH